jgi:hypothetical protein
MVSYDFLTKKDRMALVHYVRSFAQSKEPVESPEAMAALGKELAAAGERVATRIPVSLAERKLIEEERAPAPLRLGPEAPALLRRVVADEARAARVLAQSPEWRRSPEALAQAVLADVPANGFRPAVLALTGEEWKTLVELERAVTSEAEKPSAAATEKGNKR